MAQAPFRPLPSSAPSAACPSSPLRPCEGQAVAASGARHPMFCFVLSCLNWEADGSVISPPKLRGFDGASSELITRPYQEDEVQYYDRGDRCCCCRLRPYCGLSLFFPNLSRSVGLSVSQHFDSHLSSPDKLKTSLLPANTRTHIPPPGCTMSI